LEQAPVDIGKPGQEPADLEVVSGHEPDPRHQFLAPITGAGFLSGLVSEMIASLGRIFME
jgi:hypothetical protein